MSHILRRAKKKSTRSAINTLVSRELRFGGYPPRRSRITTAPAGEIEQVSKTSIFALPSVKNCTSRLCTNPLGVPPPRT